ncbi:MAG TPA: hypothetical protein VJI66_02550, partial [Candidatus Paceibacterota bacterium]
WTANITLTAGVNTINIRATDSRNNIANTSVNVTYTPVASGETIFGMRVGDTQFAVTPDIPGAVFVDPLNNCDGQGGSDCIILGGSINKQPYLAKYSATGELVWGNRLSSGVSEVRDIHVDSQGNIYATGYFAGFISFAGGTSLISNGSYDVFAAKFSSTGVLQWAKNFGSSVVIDYINESGEGITLDTNGNVYIVGIMFESVNADLGCRRFDGSGAFIIKLNSQGVCDSVKIYSGNNYLDDIVSDANGNVYATGAFSGTVDFGGGSVTAYGATPHTFFVVKYDSLGIFKWINHYALVGSPVTNSRGYSLFADSNGGIYATGIFRSNQSFGGSLLTVNGYHDIMLVKYRASDGAHLWSKRFGGPSTSNLSTVLETGLGVVSDSLGNVYMAGKVIGSPIDMGAGDQVSSGTGFKALISSFDSNGNFRWAKTLSSSKSFAEAYVLSIDSLGNPVVAGQFLGIIDLGTIILESTKINTTYWSDMYIWKLAK